MNKYKNLLVYVAMPAIVISVGAMLFNGYFKEYDKQINIDNKIPVIEENKTAFQITDNKKDLLIESIEKNSLVVVETQESIIEIPNEEIEEENNNEKEEVQQQEVENKKSEDTNRSTHITDSRTEQVDLSQHLNKYVLDVIKSYDLSDGNYPYLLNNDFENYNGVTENLYYNGELLLKGHPSGNKYSHCTGITFEVFFKAMQNRNKANGIDINDFNGMTKDELFDFMLIWYVAKGPKPESNLAFAMEKYGIGQRITSLDQVASGDFIDLSRENNTGHAVVFIDWIKEGDKIIGLKYWSSQQSTKGISYKEEYFNIKGNNGQKYGNVIIDNLYIGRISPINLYK